MSDIGFQNIALLIVIVLVLYSVASIVLWSLRNKISPMPTTPSAKHTLFSALPKLEKGTIYELGAGWGTLAIPLAKHFPQCSVVGIESSPVPFFISTLYRAFHRLPNLVLKRKDFFTEDLANASLVVCYLYPDAMRRLKDKLIQELPPGTWVVSNTFAIPGWEPENVENVDDFFGSKIYTYKTPKR